MSILHQPSVFMMAVNLCSVVEGHYECPASSTLKILLRQVNMDTPAEYLSFTDIQRICYKYVTLRNTGS